MVSMLCDPSSDGLLVHCISGWDRTPTIISLLRISLWADGQIHQSLSADQLLFLVIGTFSPYHHHHSKSLTSFVDTAYDWMLFRHSLIMRQSRGEDIFFFCFYFLEHIIAKEFSVHHFSSKLASESPAKPDSETSPTSSPTDVGSPSAATGSFLGSPAASPPSAGSKHSTSASTLPLRHQSPSHTTDTDDIFSFSGDNAEYAATSNLMVEMRSNKSTAASQAESSDDTSLASDEDVTSERVLEDGGMNSNVPLPS